MTKVLYAVIAYNNTRHSVTNLTPFEITNGHLENADPISVDLEKQLTANYNQAHKEKTKLLYDKIKKSIESQKEKVISERNKTREELPTIPEEVFVKNKQKCSKTKNKYQKETINKINKDRKTAKLIPRNPQTTGNIHLSNIKRPPKN